MMLKTTGTPHDISQLVPLLRSVEAAVYNRELEIFVNYDSTAIMIEHRENVTVDVAITYAVENGLRHEFIKM